MTRDVDTSKISKVERKKRKLDMNNNVFRNLNLENLGAAWSVFILDPVFTVSLGSLCPPLFSLSSLTSFSLCLLQPIPILPRVGGGNPGVLSGWKSPLPDILMSATTVNRQHPGTHGLCYPCLFGSHNTSALSLECALTSVEINLFCLSKGVCITISNPLAILSRNLPSTKRDKSLDKTSYKAVRARIKPSMCAVLDIPSGTALHLAFSIQT